MAVSLVRPGPVKTQIFKKAADYGGKLLGEQGEKWEESYRTGTESMMKAAVQAGHDAVDTDQTVRVITKALSVPNPKAYYFDSWQTAFQVTLLSWIPAALLDRVYDRFFHSPRK